MKLKKLEFDENDKVCTEAKIRKRIKENFTMEELNDLYDICLSHRFSDNNKKVDAINYMLRDKKFLELGAGTNRYSMLKDNYVFKFALDRFGFDDNWTEFNMAEDLQPYVTKTYECNGLIAVAEYVNIISLNDFQENKEVIRNILSALATKYLFADLGAIDKNFRNWGYNDKHELIILDYGYIFERDDLLMRCTKCHQRIGYDTNYDQMVCEKCGKKFAIHDIKRMLDSTDEERTEMFKKQEKIVLEIAPGSALYDKKDEDLKSVCKITTKKVDDEW